MKRILVVDDDEVFVRITARHLEAMGFEVIENTTGRDVQADIERHGPDACLIDIVMEEKDGLETLTELVIKGTESKIVAVSAHPTYLEWALDLGADAGLCKPLHPGELRLALAALGVQGH